MASSRIDTTVKHYVKSRNEIRIKGESAAGEEDIIRGVVVQFGILFAFVEQTGFINEEVFNDVLKKVLETLELPYNVGKCDASLIKDFITKHWYEIKPDVDGGSRGGYVLSFKDVSRDMEVSFPCQEAIKLVEQCAYIVRELIKEYCQAHGDTVCQLCENEVLIGGMVLTSPVEVEGGTLVGTREYLNEHQAEQLENGCTDTQCINDCSLTKTHQENFMATRDSLDRRTSKLNSTVCLQDIPSDQVASEQEDKNNAELSELDEEGVHSERDLNQQTTPVADSSSGSGVAESEQFITLKTFKDFPEYCEEMKRKRNMMLKYLDSKIDEIKQTNKAHKGMNCVLIYHVVQENDIKHELFENVEGALKWAHKHIHLMEKNYPFILVKKFKGAPNSSNVSIHDTPKLSVVLKDPSEILEPLEVQVAVDTGADDATMAFDSEHVKRRLHSVQDIEYDFKPVVYCIISVQGQDIENICEMDVDPDSTWSAVGVRQLMTFSEDTLRSIFNRLSQFFSTAQN